MYHETNKFGITEGMRYKILQYTSPTFVYKINRGLIQEQTVPNFSLTVLLRYRQFTG